MNLKASNFLHQTMVKKIIFSAIITLIFAGVSGFVLGPNVFVQYDIQELEKETLGSDVESLYSIKNYGIIQAKNVLILIDEKLKLPISLIDCPEGRITSPVEISLERFSANSECEISITHDVDIPIDSITVFSEDRFAHKQNDWGLGFWGFLIIIIVVFGSTLFVIWITDKREVTPNDEIKATKNTQLGKFLIQEFGAVDFKNYDEEIIMKIFEKCNTLYQIRTALRIQSGYVKRRYDFLRKYGVIISEKNDPVYILNNTVLEFIEKNKKESS